ncbi:hypothetical protein [Pseudomonas sp. MWU12-2323]|uniref:hypothetical protein n=1 Tax=Pseudomonas sp. MWU12-2323 TaxID=2651296 RepID=UPI00128BBCE9|nr:hypothetical protein [Pseudomonas sp. MWU12-2323]MPQ69396.1 hypothetical protein [Pseudomonas sp. MWU12-2323]
MVLTNVMPRYGTLEHRRLGILLLALFVLAIFLVIPDNAYAAFDGTIAIDQTTNDNVNNSFAALWKKFSIWGLWFSVFGLAISIGCMSSKGWHIPFLLTVIFMFGEMVVNGIKNIMA